VVIGSGGESSTGSAPASTIWTEAHFFSQLVVNPELVIFGSGTSLAVSATRLARIDVQAHWRNHGHWPAVAPNILAGEGRRVTAALLIETTTPPVAGVTAT
jgi:uncharacterized protein